jgi:hypothetical protein
MPSWTAKNPEENKQWATVYSTSTVGQCAWGGWKPEGRAYFKQLQARILTSRDTNAARHLAEETKCAARLLAKHENSVTKKTKKDKKKKKRVEEDEEEDESAWVFEKRPKN